MYPYSCIHGSIAWQLTPEERCCWYEMLFFSALCSERGLIADSDRHPYPHKFIAQEIHADLEVFESTLAKSLSEDRITEDEHGIHITNWKAYQSEYERQKPYRQKKDNKDDPNKYVEGKYGHVVKR